VLEAGSNRLPPCPKFGQLLHDRDGFQRLLPSHAPMLEETMRGQAGGISLARVVRAQER
jgi:hypothetical protein